MYTNKKLELPVQLELNKTPGDKYWQRLLELPEEDAQLAFQKLSDTDKKKLAFKKFVCIVGIETSTFCNRRCDYCPDKDPKYKRRTEQNLMVDQVWKRFLDDLEAVDYHSTVSLNLYNEVLADPTLEDKIKELRERVPKCFIKFNSNGDYLDYEKVQSLDKAGLDAIFITLHTAPGKPYNDDDRKKHLAQFFKRINYEGPVTQFVPGKNIRSEFFYNQMRFLVMCDNWGDYGTSRGGMIPELDSSARQKPCWRPMREFIISNKGFVYPCCQIFPDEHSNDHYRLGNINDSHMWEIYGEKATVDWRKGLFVFGDKQGVCSKCNDPDVSELSSQPQREQILKLV